MIDLWDWFSIRPIADEFPVDFLLDLLAIFIPFPLGDNSLESSLRSPSLRAPRADRHQVDDAPSVLICGESAEGDFRWRVSKLCVGRVELVVDELSHCRGLFGCQALWGILGHRFVDDGG